MIARALFMKEKLIIIASMELVLVSGQMDKNIKENGLMVNFKEKVHSSIKMAIFIKVDLKIIFVKGEEHIFIVMGEFKSKNIIKMYWYWKRKIRNERNE